MSDPELNAGGLVQRIDELLQEVATAQRELLEPLLQPRSLVRTLNELFTAAPCAPRRIFPETEIAPQIRVSFDEAAEIDFLVEAKPLAAESASAFPNVVELAFAGGSSWLALEVDMSWADLGRGRHYLLAISGLFDRSLDCRAVVRFTRDDASYLDYQFAQWTMAQDRRTALLSGELDFGTPDGIAMDRAPCMLLFFDTRADLRLRLDQLIAAFW